MIAFILPFVSVSCSGQKTEELTGVDLLRGRVEWVAATETNAAGQRNVEKAVADLSAKAWVAFVLTFAVATISLVLGLQRHPPEALPVAFVWAAMAVPLTFIPIFVGWFSMMSTTPTVHHYAGFYLATTLAVIGMLLSVGLFQASKRATGPGLPSKVLAVGIVLYLLAAVLVAIVANNAFDDMHWEDTSESS